MTDITDDGRNIDKEIDRIFDLIDGLCHKSEWTEIDRLLKEAETEKSITLRISWLTITACVKSKLLNRVDYFQNTRDRMKYFKDRDRTLGGLE